MSLIKEKCGSVLTKSLRRGIAARLLRAPGKAWPERCPTPVRELGGQNGHDHLRPAHAPNTERLLASGHS
jgi:hypothetical protein